VNMISVRVRLRTAVLGAFVLATVPMEIVLAQSSREGWKQLRNRVSFGESLDHSLEDAPVTAEERAQIYTLIDGLIRPSFTDDEREEERRIVLSTRVGLIALASNHRKQILVQAPLKFCGATGNCELWIFMRRSGKARLILEEEGLDLVAGEKTSHGFTDLVVPFHNSGSETSFSVYRWDNLAYKRVDCYIATSDPTHPEQPAITHDCPGLAPR
jgi:hypothetical protein